MAIPRNGDGRGPQRGSQGLPTLKKREARREGTWPSLIIMKSWQTAVQRAATLAKAKEENVHNMEGKERKLAKEPALPLGSARDFSYETMRN